eukprot:scaffold268069_cov35-Tisochrysis_lutea.AAC.3
MAMVSVIRTDETRSATPVGTAACQRASTDERAATESGPTSISADPGGKSQSGPVLLSCLEMSSYLIATCWPWES